MRSGTRLLLLAVIVSVVPALGSGGAVASRGISFTGGSIRATSEGRLTFEDNEAFRLLRVTCNGTLNGGMTTVVSKAAAGSLHEGLLGAIEEGRLNECVETLGGSATVSLLLEAESRSELLYESFLGTLPNITGVLAKALEFKLQVSAAGRTCLYGGATGILIGESRSGRLRFLEALRLRLVSGTEGCPREGDIAGSLRLAAAQRFALVTEAVEPARGASELAEGGRGVGLIRITAGFGLPTFIREIRDIPAAGRISVTPEARCGRWLWAGERCIITLTGLVSPASGEILIEYISGILGREIRQPYAGL